jgi:hypothetical protein
LSLSVLIAAPFANNDLIDLIFASFHFQQYFSYIMGTSFSGGKSRCILSSLPQGPGGFVS